MNSLEVHLHTRNRQYGMLDNKPPLEDDISTFFNVPLQIPHCGAEVVSKVRQVPLHYMAHNPHTKDSHNYRVVDNLD